MTNDQIPVTDRAKGKEQEASGRLSIDLLLRYLRSRTMQVFVSYRIGLGVLLLALLAVGVLQPMG